MRNALKWHYYFNQGGAAPEEGILFGDEVILWGSTTVTFED